jgi:DedD protein
MGLLSSFSRSTEKAAAPQSAADAVEAARTKARRRLIGAAILLGIGVIAFPLIFETQPRPIPVDIPIVVPAREGAPPLAMPAPVTGGAANKPAAPVAQVAQAVPAASATQAKPANKLPDIIEKAEPPKPALAKPAEKKPAVATTTPAPAPAAAASASAASRFVIQVGAFAEDEAVREARSKVEKLGLRTYIQAVDTKEGKRTRVRVGPYASREEADQAAAKLKAAGLTAAVLTL